MTRTVGGTTVSGDLIIGSPCAGRILGNSGFDHSMNSRSRDPIIYNPGLDRDRMHNSRGRIRNSDMCGRITHSPGLGLIADSFDRDHITANPVREHITALVMVVLRTVLALIILRTIIFLGNHGRVRIRSITGRDDMIYHMI